VAAGSMTCDMTVEDSSESLIYLPGGLLAT